MTEHALTSDRVERADGARLLATYLDDHWAASAGGLRLARRSLRSNRNTRWSWRLEWLAREIETDERTLALVRQELGADGGSVKRTAAVVGEVLGRFKPNGRLFAYSPLSRVLELEALIAGVSAKRSLWVSLHEAEFDTPGSLAGVDFGALTGRADEQLELLTSMHREAASVAFGLR